MKRSPLRGGRSAEPKEQHPSHLLAAIEKAEAQQRSGTVEIGNIHPVAKKIQKIEKTLPIAKGRIPQPRGMNKLESAYGEHLLGRRLAGEISWYRYEGITLKLGFDCRYTVDFFVLTADGYLEAHECKGHWEDDARVKIRVAASMFPFRFVGVQREKGEWKYEEFKG